MPKRHYFCAIISSMTLLYYSPTIMANPLTNMASGVNIHLIGGGNVTNIHASTQELSLGEVTNQINTNQSNQSSGIFGVGIGYQMDNLINTLPITLNLGLTWYAMRANFNGTELPGINLGLFPNPADSYIFTAHDSSWALMFEPKFLISKYSLQPYVITGIGVAQNRMSKYIEVPADSASSAVNPYAYGNQTNTNFSYEAGAGIQYVFYRRPSGGQLIIGVEYRYMAWGPMRFGTTANQTTTQGPSFGDLDTNIVDATLSWQF
ncbi:MAG: hypothetical protein NTW94_00210 [Legionellales bacterium]|nr:hypothetical protein [Legionellales bacterium]